MYYGIEKISELVVFSNKLYQAIEDKISARRSAFLERITGVVIQNTNNNSTKNNMAFVGMQDFSNNINKKSYGLCARII